MSLDAYDRSLLSASINFKNFVRESEEVSQSNEKSDERKALNFQGDEARVAYEEIVNRSQDVVDNKRKVNNDKNKRRQISHHERKKSETRSRDKRESRKRVTRVTANCILKSVERGDLEFLKSNITSSNVDISDDYGWTPLMSAAFCGNYKIVEFLLKSGANTRRRDKSGFTAGGLASKKNYSGIVALLKEKQSCESFQAYSSGISSPRKDYVEPADRKEFYCSVCSETFRETTVKKHEASTLHIFNTKPKLPGAVYSISKQNRGYRMLLKKGWKEEGLGPDGRGCRYPVKTVLKRDRRGLDETKKDQARVTHFKSGDSRAIDSLPRRTREKTLRKRDREKNLNDESRRDRAIRRALS